MLSEIVSTGLLKPNQLHPESSTIILEETPSSSVHQGPTTILSIVCVYVCACVRHWTVPMLQCTFKEEVEWGLHEGSPSVTCYACDLRREETCGKSNPCYGNTSGTLKKKDQVYSQGIYWIDEIVPVWALYVFMSVFCSCINFEVLIIGHYLWVRIPIIPH